MRFTIGRANIGAVLALGALLVAPPLLAQQTAAVQGTVTDGASGAPISGAVVAIVGTTLQGVPNVLGNYRIAGIPAGAVTIQVRRIGFKTLSAPVTLAEGQEFAGNYALTASVMQLEEIVVTGTAGRLERKAQAATVTDVDVAGLRQVAPTPTVANVLQSRIPGVSVTAASGTSGASSQIRVRGASSISLSNEPLVYIDGIRVNSQGAPQFFTGGQSYERLNDLEPGDIESVELVKGPAAATLYGADASPGVIQIITKRGRPGAAKFTQSLTFDYNAIDKNFTPRTNYGRCTAAQVANANNIFGWLGNSHLGSPLTRTVDSTGQNGWFGNQRDVAAMKAIDNSRQSHRSIASLTANWAPRPNFTHRLTAGLDWVREEDRRFLPKNSRNSYPINTGQINEDRRGVERHTVDYLGNFQHGLTPTLVSNLSFGFQLVETREEQVFATGEGLTVNSNDVVSAASLRSGGQDWTMQRSIGFIGQWQVGLNDRLFGQVGLRYDNSSSFGAQAKWVFLPKVGVSWVASQEPFWKVGPVNTLRLRAAWGSTGRIPTPGASLTTLQSVPYYDGSIVAPGAIPLNPGNPGLRFERGEEFEAGFDAGFMHDLIGVEVTYFDKISRDLLLQKPLPPSSGFLQPPWVNIGALVNRGFEVAVRAVPVNRPSVTWDLRIGANTLHNEVTNMGHGADSVAPFGTLNRVQEGLQLGAWWTRKIISVDTTTGVVRVTEKPVFAGNVLPTFEGNLSTNVTVMRNLRVYGLIDTKRGHRVRNFTDFFRETQLVRSNARLDTTVLSKTERLRRYGNPNVGQPAFLTPLDSAKTVNDVQEDYIQDGTFIRLRELSLSYTIPAQWARLFRATTATVTLAGQNLALWTKYQGYDPEVVSNAVALYNRDDFFTQPPVRRYVLRVNLTF